MRACIWVVTSVVYRVSECGVRGGEGDVGMLQNHCSERDKGR